MHEYYEIEVELTEIEPRIWRRFLLPSSATLRKLHEAIEDAFDWGNWRPGYFYTYGDESDLIAGDYWDDDAEDPRTGVPSMWDVPMRDHLGPEPGTCIGFTYGLYRQWKHRVTLRAVVSLEEEFVQKLVAGGRAHPPRNTFDLAEYHRCVEYVRAGRPEGFMPEQGVRVPPKWDPDVFDFKKERRAFDIGASPAAVIEQRFAENRRVAEFWTSLEERPLERFDTFLIQVALAKGARHAWRSMLACDACKSRGRQVSVDVWIDPNASTACFRCPECEATGVAHDISGQPVVLPEVEDVTRLADPVVVELSHGDFLELASHETPFGGAEELIFSAEHAGQNVRIAGEYDRMQTLQMFAWDHADDWVERDKERFERLRRVAEVIGDEL